MLGSAQIRTIDNLNIVLIAVSAVCAIRWPFETLLLAYAILGPLHYLTEISWLHDRRYFLPRRRDALPIAVVGLALILTIGSTAAADKGLLRLAVENAAMFALFGAALILVLTPAWPRRLAALVALLPLCWWLARSAPFARSLADCLPALIHVYLFTGLFMVLGWLRNRSQASAGALAAFLAFPLLCWLVPLGASAAPTTWAETNYVGTLSAINALVLGNTGLHLQGPEFLRHPASVLVTRVLAFAYLYHYLNWFSKIDVIGWGRISAKRTMLIIAIWAGSVTLYAHNYLLGFAFLLILSFMHVVLEFPLNHLSMREIYTRLRA